MARPETWNDLPKHEKRGDELVRWSGYSIMEYPAVSKHLVSAAEAAQKLDLVVDNEGIYQRPSPEVLEDRLRRAQERWDELEAKYQVAADYSAPKSDLWEINNWARANDRPLIKAFND